MTIVADLRSAAELPQRAAHRIVPQAELANERERREEAVDQAAEPEQADGKQQPGFALDRLEIGKRREQPHVGGRENILRRLRHFQPDRLGGFQGRIPQMREMADDEPRLARAQRVQRLEHALTVVERAERVDHHDDVERSRQRANERRILDVADQKREIGMSLARLLDHALAEIHADAERRRERGQEIAGAASELEHAGARGDQELEVEQILVVEKCRAGEPCRALGRAGVGQAADGLLARRHGLCDGRI